jgi:hypothetical protein
MSVGNKPGQYQVLWSEVHHGQRSPERPWCVIWRSPPDTLGEPQNGIRYLESFADRGRAIERVASLRAWGDRRVARSRAKHDALVDSIIAEIRAELEQEVEIR